MTLADAVIAVIGADGGEVAVPAPGDRSGFWAGAASAIWTDGAFWLAYRLRRPVDAGRGYANVIARSPDGVHFETVSVLSSDQFGSASLERPALVRRPDGGWRLYVSCSRANSKAWWVEALDAPSAEALPGGERHLVLADDEFSAWKDVVVHPGRDGWRMWACRHPLDGGDDEADRMSGWYFEGDDGLRWPAGQPALSPTPGSWDARGTRIASVVRRDDEWVAFYDGRASAAQNWRERTGVASGTAPAALTASGGPTRAARTCRYLSIVGHPGGTRIYWEADRPDGAHDLLTAAIDPPAG